MLRGKNVSSNQRNDSQKIQSQISGEKESRSVYEKYQNVYLSESEYGGAPAGGILDYTCSEEESL